MIYVFFGEGPRKRAGLNALASVCEPLGSAVRSELGLPVGSLCFQLIASVSEGKPLCNGIANQPRAIVAARSRCQIWQSREIKL
jgi:hypothetical protein